ncbi:MAG: phosphoserine phosphatase SerB [Rhodospirillales bacterium]|nr:phosphoserine phosphatase SerB [Rhodospirillales bacterium]
MINVLTLITNPNEPGLDDGLVSEVAAVLDRLGAHPGEPEWLDPEIACDLPFEGGALEDARAAVREILQGWPVDVIAQTVEGRRKKLLIADMDSTIVIGETLDDLAAFTGLKDRVQRITERAMNGEVGFRDALIERVGLLAGLPADTLDRAMALVELTPGATTLVRTMRANGAFTALVSGGFTFFTARVRETVGFHLDKGNVLEIADGRLTGRVIEPIVNKDTKLEMLRTLAEQRGIPLGETAAVGDGANDLPMLQAAGLGLAYHAKPVVMSGARHRVEHGDLTALLYAQGYRREDFVDGSNGGDQSSG